MTWPEYDLDDATRALLRFASALTESPALVGDAGVDALREAGWSEAAIWEITALVSFFNFTGRMEAASGLPADEFPSQASLAESTAE